MHNVPPDQIQKNIRLIQLVQKYPCIYNPAIASSSGECVYAYTYIEQ